jgi:hypothetical protein
VCGPQRDPGDGLRIFPGPVEGRDLVACPWTPDPSLASALGAIRPEFLWAALDCPGGFAFSWSDEGTVLLGELHVELRGEVSVGERCMLVAWELAREGRKHHTASALFGESGTCTGIGIGTWFEITVRRSITASGLTTPKSGKARRVTMPVGLASELFDLLAARRRETLARGWPEVPAWVFCSEAATAPNPANVDRVWSRVRRHAVKQKVRPFKLHCARHTWATRALQAGKNIRWVADQLGHADPSLTLRVYAHAMPSDETDLSFADFGVSMRLRLGRPGASRER